MKTVTKTRLSKETLTILKNYSSINSNILIKPGSTLKTVSPGMNILAEAKVQEEFDTDIAIWDLNKFLGVISLFQNPDLEFNEKYVDISNGNASVRYYYTEQSLLTIPTKAIKMPPCTLSFDLDEENLNELLKAASILQVNDIKIIAEDEKIQITVNDSSNSTSNSFSLIVDENYSGDNYFGTFNVSEIKFLPGSYTVELTSTNISKFTHKTQNLFYYIAIKKN